MKEEWAAGRKREEERRKEIAERCCHDHRGEEYLHTMPVSLDNSRKKITNGCRSHMISDQE